MAVALLDSTVVVGFLLPADPFHQAADERVRQLAHGDGLVASVVTYAELMTGALLRYQPTDAVRGFFVDLIARVIPVDAEVAERAAELRAGRRSLRMPDALIIATAEVESSVERIVCGDAEWSKVPGMTVEVEVLEPTRG